MIHLSKLEKQKMRNELYKNGTLVAKKSVFKKKSKLKKINAKKVKAAENIKKKLEKFDKRQSFQKSLEMNAHLLNNNLPKSEVWFWKLFEPYKTEFDKPNIPIVRFIYDVVNFKLKYAIEIDGSSHDNFEQKAIDKQKNIVAKKSGFKMIRIKAYDQSSFDKALRIIKSIKGVKIRRKGEK